MVDDACGLCYGITGGIDELRGPIQRHSVYLRFVLINQLPPSLMVAVDSSSVPWVRSRQEITYPLVQSKRKGLHLDGVPIWPEVFGLRPDKIRS